MIAYDSPKQLAVFLRERGLALKKKFGQNFLVNPGTRAKILAALAPERDDRVWEIGPGLGCMTGVILDSGAEVKVFEIDRGFIEVLRSEFGGNPRFSLVAGDVLRTWREHRKEAPAKVFGNLPYSAASAIIADFLEEGFLPGLSVFMVQKEVASRMAAKPGTKNYSSFSVLCQAFLDVGVLFDVAAGSFYPPPEVVSSVVELRPRSTPPKLRDRGLFLEIARSLFASRRKTLKNNLQVSSLGRRLGAEALSELFREAGIDPDLRGERLSADEIAALSDAASSMISR